MTARQDANVMYIDCFSGVSGDMLLAGLVHLGVPPSLFHDMLRSLGFTGFGLEVEDLKSGAIQGKKVVVRPAEKDMTHRNLAAIHDLIERSDLSRRARKKGKAVFTTLAGAEAAIHGRRIEAVHFHEVGALDAIADIMGAVVGMEHLGVDEIICSPLPMPRGWVHCSHGPLPLPAPAVCEILRDTPVYGVDVEGELVTPTGAAIVKTLSDGFGPMPPMILKKTGYGAGSRALPDGRPNMVRLILGEADSPQECQEIEVIETHLDDMPPEVFPYVSDKLLSLGALDVTLVPIQMKKGRTGILLRILADPANGLELKRCVLAETTAIGLRFRRERRMTLPRREEKIDTKWGPVAVKRVVTPSGPVLYPEYEECRRIAAAQKVPLLSVYREVYKNGGGNGE